MITDKSVRVSVPAAPVSRPRAALVTDYISQEPVESESLVSLQEDLAALRSRSGCCSSRCWRWRTMTFRSLSPKAPRADLR
ncbi:hypothetical protein EK904_014420 [Melospiza melodia maxima]|nr:hypothetical protein EK904_014420 [Melospiza melodia maxima]